MSTRRRSPHASALAAALISILGLVLALPSPLGASQGPPVTVHLVSAPAPAAAGQPYVGKFELHAARPVALSGFRLEGEGWRQIAVDLPPTVELAARTPLPVQFTAVPADPERPLVVAFEVDGHTVRESLDLSPRHFRRMTEGAAAQALPAGARILEPRAGAAGTAASTPLPADVVAAIVPATADAQKYGITVTGRWLHQRYDNVFEWTGVDGALVQVMHRGWLYDELLGAAYTFVDGQFSITVSWNSARGLPNLYVQCVSRSAHIELRDQVWQEFYLWQSSIAHDFTGTTLTLGNLLLPDDEGAAGHLITQLERNWRWHQAHGYDNGVERVYWPATPGGFHSGDDHAIYMGDNKWAWQETALAHEYAHHWQGLYTSAPDQNYCNGICDQAGCNHCPWCPEHDPTAMVEGFASFMGDIVPWDLEIEYGVPSIERLSFEDLYEFQPVCGSLVEPDSTEGYLAAALRDICDETIGDQHFAFGSWRDMLTEGPEEILAVCDLDDPYSPQEFFAAYLARYPGVNKANLWETAKNSGYEIDGGTPGAVTNLRSTSHTVGVASPDQTIELAWSHAADDVAGVAGYGIFVHSSAFMPSTVQDIGKVTNYTTSALTPGTWYFNIRAVDRAGNWSATYASVGPFVVREPQPSDLEPNVSAGWTRPLVPREDDGALITDVPEPVLLAGNAAATWWNLNGLNGGETASGAFTARVFVDGASADSRSWLNVGAGVSYKVTNEGPLTVRGGRHTFEVFHDASEQVAETDEGNNRWARQYVWSPLLLTTGALTTRAAPPPYQAGWDAVVDGSARYFNCDGLSLSSALYVGGTHSWDAIYLYATDDEVDYDCRLHAHSTGATDGFAGANLGWSARAAGCLDAVIVNGAAAGIGTRDVGVLNDSEGACDYRAMRLRAADIALDDSVSVPLAQYEMMAMRRFDIAAADTGWYTVRVVVDPPTQPVQVQHYLPTFTTGPLSVYDGRAVSANGQALLNLHVTQPGRHALVVFREPRHGTAPCTLTIETGRTPPDFTPVAAAGWHAPIVPRPAADGTPTLVALPDTLHGNVGATYFNLCRENDSPAAWTWDGVHQAYATAHVDGAANYEAGVANSSYGAHQVRTYNQTTPRTVRGGRHTVAITLDGSGTIEELDEANNSYAEQYCWSPLVLTFGTTTTRAAPPDRIGGWSQIRSGETRWYNCDGLRLPSGPAESWRAVAVMPGTGADVDVRLHFALAGAKGGFATSLVTSAWGPGESDFVLVHAHEVPGAPPFTRPFDAGALLGSGAADYTAEAALGAELSPAGNESFGPYTLGDGHVLHLYSLWLTPGPWALLVDNVAGAVDWGLSVHDPIATFSSKSAAVDGGLAYLAPGGADEMVALDVASAGRYAVAVWKRTASDLPAAGTYRLRAMAGVTGVDDGPPPARGTALVSIKPNPFNPQTRIVFDLAAAGPARLEIYDLRGVLVRTLVSGERPAGRYEAIWDGRDDDGQEAASGVYMARLTAGTFRQMGKMTLLK